jgi:hypothetical protein
MRRIVGNRKVLVASDLKPSQLDEPPPLTRAQVREITRRVRDLDDRTRYLIVSVFTAKHALYYDVSDDVFAMNAPASGTLFKRRSAALAIQRLLCSHVEIIQCRVNRRGRLIKRSLPRLRSASLPTRRRRKA